MCFYLKCFFITCLGRNVNWFYGKKISNLESTSGHLFLPQESNAFLPDKKNAVNSFLKCIIFRFVILILHGQFREFSVFIVSWSKSRVCIISTGSQSILISISQSWYIYVLEDIWLQTLDLAFIFWSRFKHSNFEKNISFYREKITNTFNCI